MGCLFLLLWLLGAGCASPTPKPSEPGSSADPDQAASDINTISADKRAKIYAHYATGLIHELNQHADEATREYYEAAMIDPANEELVLEAAQRLLDKKDYDKALKLLQRAAQASHQSSSILLYLGKTEIQTGKTNLAIGTFQKLLKQQPDSGLAYVELVQAYRKSGQTNAARQLLDKAFHRCSGQAEFALDTAELLIANQDLLGKQPVKTQVLHILKPVAAKLTDPPILRLRLAEVYTAIEENTLAVEQLSALYENNPALPGLAERLTDTYLRTGQQQKAVEMLEKIIRDQPLNPEAYYLLGHLFSELKDYKKAADYFHRCTVLNPESNIPYFDLAAMRLTLKQPQEALQALETIRGRVRRNFLIEFYSAMAYSQLKDYAKSLSHIIEAEVIANATETNRLTPVLYFQLGAVYERNKDFQQAEKYFQKCLGLNPEDAETLNYLGYMWVDQGIKLEEAKDLIEKAVRIEPKNAAFLDSLAWVLYKLNRIDEAMGLMLKAVEFATEPDATLYDHLGDIHAAKNQMDPARAAWRKSIEIEPNESVKKKLEAAGP